MSGQVKMIELLVSFGCERFKGKSFWSISAAHEKGAPSWETIHNTKNPGKLMEMKQTQISFLSKFALMEQCIGTYDFSFGGVCNFYTRLKFVSKGRLSFVTESIKSFIWAVSEHLIKL